MGEEGFRSDSHIIMFPAGICSRRRHGVIQDLPWKKTFVTKSVETHVMWCRFTLREETPISSTIWRMPASFWEYVFNIAMLYLADEMFKNRHKTFRVAIGKPIPWQTFNRSKSPVEWAAYVRDLVYKL